MTHVFDINAPIERQRSGVRKVLHIHDSGIDCTHPIAVWLEGGVLSVFTRDGKPMYSEYSRSDLHTLPEPLPLIVSYHNVYTNGFVGEGRERVTEGKIGVIAVFKSTFDPNTGESSAKTVWPKGESA